MKKYAGYKSYSYLEDCYLPKFKLSKEVGRVPSKLVELSKPEEERVDSILRKYVKISFHDHSIVFPENPEEYLEYVRKGRFWIGYEGLAASKLDGVFEGLLDGIGSINSRDPWDWDNIIYQIGIVASDIAHQDFVFIARSHGDFEKAFEEGRLAMVLHLEAPPRIGGDLDRIDVLYGLGVRCMGLAYSRGNEFASGLADKKDYGLTDLGLELIDRMNKLGILIDLAHASDKTCLEAIEESEKPVAITHAGARAVWPSRRMKPDEVIQALAEKNGVFGVEAAPHTTLSTKNPRHTLESVMEHFQYIVDLVGVDHVAFGPDTLFGDHVGLHEVFSRELSIRATEEDVPSFEKVAYVDGIENPSQYVNIVRWLVKNGYSDGEIAKVIGGNILRLVREVW